jgi:predicted transglutaminase-like cysteine proteinase
MAIPEIPFRRWLWQDVKCGVFLAGGRRQKGMQLGSRVAFLGVVVEMRLGVICALAANLFVMGFHSASAEPHTSSYQGQQHSVYMRAFGVAQPPHGFVQFCDSQPHHCQSNWRGVERFRATPERLSELDEVNRLVNAAVQPVTDLEAYGVEEYWTLPTNRGDCEDYALLKRKILIQRGWPQSALLLTVVRDELGEGHAVLTARTAQGDFVLDNKITDVRIWHATPYKYLMRQSYVNPEAWVSLEEAIISRPVVSAGSSNR